MAESNAGGVGQGNAQQLCLVPNDGQLAAAPAAAARQVVVGAVAVAGQGVAQPPGLAPNGPPAAALQQRLQVAPVAVGVAGPVIANQAGALPPPHLRFDIGAALLGPLPTTSDIGCYIHPKID